MIACEFSASIIKSMSGRVSQVLHVVSIVSEGGFTQAMFRRRRRFQLSNRRRRWYRNAVCKDLKKTRTLASIVQLFL
jgi:hypothetical protein